MRLEAIRRRSLMEKNKINLVVGEFVNTLSINYLTTNHLYVKAGQTIVKGKSYRVKFRLYYSIRANNSTNPSEIRIDMGAVGNYASKYAKITNASTTDYITASIDFDFVFIANISVNDLSSNYQKQLVQVIFGNKNGTVSLSNLTMTEV